MTSLLLGALRARRAQAVLLALLALLAGAAAAAAPRYLLAAVQTVAVGDVSAAAASERVVSLRKDVAPEQVDGAVDEALSLTFDRLPEPAFDRVRGVGLAGTLDGRQDTVLLVDRDGACERVVVRGRCPTGDGEVMVDERTAKAAGLGTGGTVRFQPRGRKTAGTLTIVGSYLPRAPEDPYWAAGGRSAVATVTAPFFVTGGTIRAQHPAQVTAMADLILRDGAFRGQDPAAFAHQLQAAQIAASRAGFTASSTADVLAGRVRADQQLIRVAVPVVAVQLLLMCWFALFLSVRYTANERRIDLGLLKLRGAGRLRSWVVVGGQSALPVAAGGLAGAVPGFALAAGIAGPVAGGDAARRALWLSAAAAVAAAVAGALAVALLAEWRALRTPVGDLLRRVPQRRSGWRARTGDLVAVALAAAGVYQAGVAGDDARGLVLLVPGLLALASGLVAARLLSVAAARVGRAALRAGRPATVLVAGHLARGRGAMRVGVLLTVAVALLVHAGLGWSAAGRARAARATQELGADRVYTVQAATRFQLLNAVRSADPGGRYAMAAVVTAGRLTAAPVLAVDTTRLAAVASWRPEYGPVAELARRLRPDVAGPVGVHGAELSADVTYLGAAGVAARLRAELIGPLGERLDVDLGRLAEGRRGYRAATPACEQAGGCRLAGLAVTQTATGDGRPVGGGPSAGGDAAAPSAGAGTAPTPATDGLPGPAVAVLVHAVGQREPDTTLLGTDRLRDRTRWRLPAGTPAGTAAVSRPDGLLLHLVYGAAQARVLVVDAPVPAPVVVAGGVPRNLVLGNADVRPFGTGGIAATVAATAPVLPRLGDSGLLVDLEYADRLVADGGAGETMQVWLARGAPRGILERLRSAGVVAVGDATVAGLVARFAAQGPGLVVRYELLAVIAGLLLAAGVLLVVTAVERPSRSAELSALRAQGVADRVVRAACFGGYPVLVAAFGSLGAGAAVLAATVMARFPVFVDGRAVLAEPGAVGAAALGVTAGSALAVLGAVAGFGSARLLRAARRRRGWSA